jgi:hypothetical protein
MWSLWNQEKLVTLTKETLWLLDCKKGLEIFEKLITLTKYQHFCDLLKQLVIIIFLTSFRFK